MGAALFRLYSEMRSPHVKNNNLFINILFLMINLIMSITNYVAYREMRTERIIISVC